MIILDFLPRLWYQNSFWQLSLVLSAFILTREWSTSSRMPYLRETFSMHDVFAIHLNWFLQEHIIRTHMQFMWKCWSDFVCKIYIGLNEQSLNFFLWPHIHWSCCSMISRCLPVLCDGHAATFTNNTGMSFWERIKTCFRAKSCEWKAPKGSWNFYIHKDMYKEQKLWLYTDWSYFDSWETCDIVKGSWGFYTSILFRDVDRHNPQLCSNDACPPLYRHLEGILFKILFKIYQDLYLFRTLYTKETENGIRV